MLEQCFSAPYALARFRAAPGGAYLDKFCDWLNSQRYRSFTVKIYVRLAVRFTRWAETRGLTTASLCQTHLDAYKKHLESLGRHGRNGRSSIEYAAARRWVAFLHDAKIAKGPRNGKPPETPLLTRFQQWMRSHRGAAEATIANYSRAIRELIQTLGSQPGAYEPGQIREFVLSRVGRYGPGYAEQTVTSVRSFIRFLIALDEVPDSFQHLIPCVASWRDSRLPRYMMPTDVEKAINSCNPSTSLGARDHAIVLLLARLGLRAGDIAGLACSDLEWPTGTIRLTGKGRCESRLPLPQDVGDAVLHYLSRWRPVSASDRVFLMSRAPYSPIASHVVSQIARRAISRAGVQAPSRGAHVFRHSVATSMLRAGASLQSIGRILRHTAIESTAHYAKVDTSALAQLVRPWPEATSC